MLHRNVIFPINKPFIGIYSEITNDSAALFNSPAICPSTCAPTLSGGGGGRHAIPITGGGDGGVDS